MATSPQSGVLVDWKPFDDGLGSDKELHFACSPTMQGHGPSERIIFSVRAVQLRTCRSQSRSLTWSSGSPVGMHIQQDVRYVCNISEA